MAYKHLCGLSKSESEAKLMQIWKLFCLLGRKISFLKERSPRVANLEELGVNWQEITIST
ncbi:hypothetical protein OROGR_021643 [Orobanche gracilis]